MNEKRTWDEKRRENKIRKKERNRKIWKKDVRTKGKM